MELSNQEGDTLCAVINTGTFGLVAESVYDGGIQSIKTDHCSPWETITCPPPPPHPPSGRLLHAWGGGG